MSTPSPDILPSGILLPPPFRSTRIQWIGSNSTNTMPSSRNVSNNPYKEHRIGFHPLIGSGTKSQIYSSNNRTYNHALPTTKVPIISLPSLSVVNSIVAVYLIIVILTSVVSNSIVMVVAANKRSRGRSKSNHICTLCLAITDTLFSLLFNTIMVAASLGIVDIEKVFNGQGCNYYGFGVMFFGIFSMCIHACISFIRYLNICHPDKVEWLDIRYVILLILASIVYSATWALGPVMDWERYETFDFDCTIDLGEKTKRGRLVIALVFTFVLLFPLGVLVTCYALIVVQAFKFQKELCQFTNTDRGGASDQNRLSTRSSSFLRHSIKRKPELENDEKFEESKRRGSAREDKELETEDENDEIGENMKNLKTDDEEVQKSKEMFNTDDGITSQFIFDRGSVQQTQRSLRLQAKLIRMSMVLAGGYILAWMPYATMCVWVSYGNASLMPEGFRVGASLFCKSATAYNPFIYFFMSQSFRKDVNMLCKKKKRSLATSGVYPPQLNVSRASSQPASIRSFEEGSMRSRSLRGDSFHHRLPSVRRTSTSTMGSRNSNFSLASNVFPDYSMAPPVDGAPPIWISPCPERRRHSHLPPPSPSAVHRMQSLPHNSKSLHGRSLNVRRLSSTPYREETTPDISLSRRSSLSITPDMMAASRNNTFHRSGRISSSSLRLPTNQSPVVDRKRGKGLSQSFRSSSSTTKVTVHRKDSWMDAPGGELRRPKSTREIQKDLESIISNEFKGNLRLDFNNHDLKLEENGRNIIRRKSLRSTTSSPNQGSGSVPDPPSHHHSRSSKHLQYGSRKEKRETSNFLELPNMSKDKDNQQDPRGPVRSRSLHGRPTDYKQDHPKTIFSEY